MHNDSENSLICTTEIHCCMQKCAWVCVNKSLPSPCSWCYEAGNPIIPHLACITKNIIIGHKIIQPFQKSNLWTLWLYSSGWLHALWGSASFNGFNSACIISGCTLVWEKVGVKWLIFLLKCLGIFVWEQTPGSGQSFNILCMAFPKSKPNNNNHHLQQYLFSKCAPKWNVNTLMNSFCSKTACMWPNGNRPLFTGKMSILI